MAGVAANSDWVHEVCFTNRPPPLMMNQRNRRGRNLGRGMWNDAISVHCRHRPGHDQLRGGVRRHARAGSGPRRTSGISRCRSWSRRARRRRGRCCRRFCTCRASTSCPRCGAAALERRGRPDRRRVRPDPGRAGAQPAGQQRQELALPSRGRSRGRHPPLGQPARDHEGLAGRGLGRLSAAHPRCLELHVRAR